MKVFIVTFWDGYTPEQNEIKGVFCSERLAKMFVERQTLKHCFFVDEHVVIDHDEKEVERTFEEDVVLCMKTYEKENTEDWEIVDEYRTHIRKSEEIGSSDSSSNYHLGEVEIILEVIKRKGIDIEKN